MHRLLLLFVVLGLQLFDAAPVWALSGCDVYATETPRDLEEMRGFLERSATMRTLRIAQHVTIRYSAWHGSFGPIATSEDGRNVIAIPRGFRKLHCDLVFASFLVSVGPTSITIVTLKQAVEECLRRGHAPVDCLSETLDRFQAPLEATYAALSPADRDNAQSLAAGAFEFLLLHEFAHLVLGQLDERDTATQESARLEFEADLLALRYSLTTRGEGASATQNFYLLGVIDQQLLGGVSTHDNYFCRSENAFNIQGMTADLPVSLYASARLTDEGASPARAGLVSRLRRRLGEIATSGEFGIPPHHTPSCRFNGLPQLETLRDDLLALARFQAAQIDTLPGSDDTAGIVRLLAQLSILPLLSAEAKTIRANLLVAYILSYAPENRDRALSDAMRQALADRILPDAIAGDIAALYGVAGLRSLAEAGARLSREDASLIGSLLGFALHFNGYDEDMYAGYLRVEMREGNCREAQRLFNTGRFSAPLQQTLRAELMAAGCVR